MLIEEPGHEKVFDQQQDANRSERSEHKCNGSDRNVKQSFVLTSNAQPFPEVCHVNSPLSAS